MNLGPLHCSNCAHINAPEAAFCELCGHPLASQPQAVSWFCENCGHALLLDSTFCERCGHRVAGQPPVPPAAPSVPATIIAPPIQPGGAYPPPPGGNYTPPASQFPQPPVQPTYSPPAQPYTPPPQYISPPPQYEQPYNYTPPPPAPSPAPANRRWIFCGVIAGAFLLMAVAVVAAIAVITDRVKDTIEELPTALLGEAGELGETAIAVISPIANPDLITPENLLATLTPLTDELPRLPELPTDSSLPEIPVLGTLVPKDEPPPEGTFKSTPQIPAGDIPLTLVNATSERVYNVWIGIPGGPWWLADLLPEKYLNGQERVTVYVQAGDWALLAEDVNGRPVRYEPLLAVNAPVEWTIAPGGEAYPAQLPACGNNTCNEWEHEGNCPADCTACGNNFCGADQSLLTCYQDCR